MRRHAAWFARFTEAPRGRGYTVSRDSGWRDYLRGRNHFDYGQPEHTAVVRFAIALCDGGAETTARIHRQYSPIVFHALRCDSAHGRPDAVSDVEELVRCGVNDQHDRATDNLWRDVSFGACVSTSKRCSAGWFLGAGRNDCRNAVAPADRVAVASQHVAGSKNVSDSWCRRFGDLLLLLALLALFVNHAAVDKNSRFMSRLRDHQRIPL